MTSASFTTDPRRAIRAALAGAALALAGCATASNDTTQSANATQPGPTITTEEQAKRAALSFVPGAALEAERKFEEGASVWEVEIRVAGSEGVVAVLVDDLDGALRGIEAKEGPFEYELAPVVELLSYGRAKGLALAANPGRIEEWELMRRNGVFFYGFEIRDETEHLTELKLDARTGEIVDREQKPDVE